MLRLVKVLIGELDGEELGYQQEHTLLAKDIEFKAGSNKSVDDRLLITNPVPRVLEEADVEVEDGKIMFLHEPEFRGNLILRGDLVAL